MSRSSAGSREFVPNLRRAAGATSAAGSSASRPERMFRLR